ncbi:MAG: hypothetical protein EU544_03390, partial [Promethearchaeota archaeon]
MELTKESNAISKPADRVTIALDEEPGYVLEKFKKQTSDSQSEIFRKALKYYDKYGQIFDEKNNINKKLNMYLEMLGDGEHIIIDVDHYLSILKFIEDSENKDNFWKEHREIGRQHADQFKHKIKT